MGVPTSEVGYTSAMPRREDHEVHKDMWGHWGGGDNETTEKDKAYAKRSGSDPPFGSPRPGKF